MAASVVAPPPAAPAVTPAPAHAPAPSTAPPAGSMSDLLRASFAAADAAPAAPITEPAAPAAEPQITSPEATEPAAATPPVTEPAAPVTEPEQQPQPPAEGAAAEEPLDFSEGVDPDSKSEDGKRYFTSAARWQKFQRAAQIVTELQQVMPVVTPEALRERVEKANAADQMMTLFLESAHNPTAIKEVVDLFTDNGTPDEQQKRAFGTFVLESLSRLPQVNPQAFQHVLDVHNRGLVEKLRNDARQTADPNARKEAIALALRFEQKLYGKYTPSNQWIGGQQVDPAQARIQQLEEENQRFQDAQRKAQETQQQQWQQQVGNAQETAIADEIRAVLPRDKFEKTPYWEPMQRDIRAAIAKAESEHPEWGQQWETLQKAALMFPSEKNLKAVVDFRRGIARMVGRRMAPEISGKYSSVILNSNQAAVQRASQVPNEPSPNGVGTPAPNGAMEQVIKEPDLKKSLSMLFRGTPGR